MPELMRRLLLRGKEGWRGNYFIIHSFSYYNNFAVLIPGRNLMLFEQIILSLNWTSSQMSALCSLSKQKLRKSKSLKEKLSWFRTGFALTHTSFSAETVARSWNLHENPIFLSSCFTKMEVKKKVHQPCQMVFEGEGKNESCSGWGLF
jgi:hypothetical protein